MSQGILKEVDFFVNSLLVGIIITFAYDWLLIFRKCIRHNILCISIEDAFFWFACAIGVFYFLYHENNGILRWFAILGATMGMFIYKKLVSTLFVTLTSQLIIKTFQILTKPILYICRFILRLLRAVSLFLQKKYLFFHKKARKVKKIAKNKLTLQAKLIRIYLCKQTAAGRQFEKRLKERYGQKDRVS